MRNKRSHKAYFVKLYYMAVLFLRIAIILSRKSSLACEGERKALCEGGERRPKKSLCVPARLLSK